MDPSFYSTRNNGLSLEQLLQEMEEVQNALPLNIFAIPPQDGDDTDMDEDFSDDEHMADLNCLGPKMLKTTCFAEPIVHENIFKPQNNHSTPSCSHWDSSDEEPLSNFVKKNRAENISSEKPTAGEGQTGQKYTKVKFSWTKSKPNFNIIKNCNEASPSEEAKNCQGPLEFFKLFFNDKIINHILEQTNLYAGQKNNILNLTLEELYVFFGVLLFSGYGKYPSKRMLWSNSPDVPMIVQDSIRLNRFEQILKNVHLNDNTNNNQTDRLFKLRPLITHLNEAFQKHGGLEENLSIDESMIPYYGKHYAKQYIKGKPIRFGFKNWALCSSFGYLLSFEIYTGKSINNNKVFGIGGDTVVSLITQANIPPHNGHKIFFDNYFSSSGLLHYLSEKGYCATGTIQDTRTGKCPLIDNKSMDKKNRGEYDFQTDTNNTISLVRWKDNRSVTCITNYDSLEESSCIRYSREVKGKITLPQPKPIANYNKGMGGVDKMDQAVAAYRTRIRQRKWWWPIFSYLLDVSVSNAWLLMRKLCPNDPLAMGGLLKFRRSIALNLLRTYGTPSSRGKKVQAPSDHLRFDGKNHLIEYNITERRCGMCSKKAHFICDKCNIGLHPKNCFKAYHSN